MSTGRAQAIERTARQLLAMLHQGRRAVFTTGDTRFRQDVLRRLEQIMRGEDPAGRYENPDD